MGTTHSTLSLFHKSRPWYDGNEWAQLCSSKSLFTKTGELDLAFGPQLWIPCIWGLKLSFYSQIFAQLLRLDQNQFLKVHSLIYSFTQQVLRGSRPCVSFFLAETVETKRDPVLALMELTFWRQETGHGNPMSKLKQQSGQGCKLRQWRSGCWRLLKSAVAREVLSEEGRFEARPKRCTELYGFVGEEKSMWEGPETNWIFS